MCVCVCLSVKYVQAALVIRGFAIRGFDYSRFIFCSQNLIFAVFLRLFAVFTQQFIVLSLKMPNAKLSEKLSRYFD
jgi:hypothetical protein